MERTYKLLALDIDGTLLPEFDSRLSDEMLQGLRSASRCVELALITGRSFDEVAPLLEDLRLPGVWLGLGGGVEVLSPEGKLVARAAFESGEQEVLLRYAENHREVKVLVAGEWRALAESIGEVYQALFIPRLSIQEANDLRAEAATQFPSLYVSLVTDSDYPGLCSVFFQPRSATKGTALQEIQRRLGVTVEETASAGDMSLDIPMFEQSGLSAAMANAPKEVQSRAAVVLPDVRSDGVLELIKMLKPKNTNLAENS